jgi:hypothetical protein
MNTFDASLLRLKQWAGGNKLAKPKQMNSGLAVPRQNQKNTNVARRSIAGIVPPSASLIDSLKSRPQRYM